MIRRSNRKHYRNWRPEYNCQVCQPGLRWKGKKYRPNEYRRLDKDYKSVV